MFTYLLLRRVEIPGEIKSMEVLLDPQVSPEEIKRREGELDPQVSPEEIQRREGELGLKAGLFCFICFPMVDLRTLCL